MNKAIFLDRDGTINYDYGYISKCEEVEFIPGVIEGLRTLYNNRYILIIITNQSGISRGYFSEKALIEINSWLISYLCKNGVIIEKIYYCPHYQYGAIKKYAIKCNCRKPKLELFYNAIDEFNIDVTKSYVIGDRLSDLALVETEKCNGILVGNTESESTISLVKKGLLKKIVYCNDLLEGSKYILTQEHNEYECNHIFNL